MSNLNKIRIILNDDGTMNTRYSDLTTVINQYATNYLLEVAYLNDNSEARSMKIVFNVKGISQPPKVLSPTIERLILEEDPEVRSYFVQSYKFTQYETQYYQDTLNATLYIYNKEETEISNINISLVMAKANYNKLTPVNLDTNSSLNSVINSLYDFRSSLEENIYDISDPEGRYALKSELPDFTKYYTIEEVNTAIGDAITDVIGGAPEAFDTLRELYDFVLNNSGAITGILEKLETKADKTTVYTKSEIDLKELSLSERIGAKQERLVSGTNIATINGKDILNRSNVDITLDDMDITPIQTQITSQASATLKSANSYTDDKISTVNSSLSSLSGRVGQTESSINGLSLDVSTLSGRVDTLETKVNNLADIDDEDFDTLKEVAAYIRNDMIFNETVTQNINNINISIADIQSDITTINTSITDIQADINTVNTSITDIQTDITTINASITDIQSDINTVNTSITDIQSDITTINGKITGIDDISDRVQQVEIEVLKRTTEDAVNALIEEYVSNLELGGKVAIRTWTEA